MRLSLDAQPSGLRAARGPRVLVVEDELFIRTMLSEELRETGFEVIEAFNGDEALAVLKTDVHIDLIISDVHMPGSVDGMGLLAVVKKAFPTLPVILTSGLLGPASAIAGGACQFVPKPYSLDLMGNVVREELAKSA